MRRFLRSDFLNGVVLGLAVTMGVPLSHASNTTDNPYSCENVGNLPPAEAAVMSMYCDLRGELFPACTEPTMAYVMEEVVLAPGGYSLTALNDQPGKLDVVWCLVMPPLDTTPEIDAAIKGLQVSMVVDHLIGANEVQVPIQGMTYSYKVIATGEQVYRFVVTTRPSEQVVGEYAEATRMAGGPRLVDAQTGVAYALGASLPGDVTDAWFSPTDLSTIYCSFVGIAPAGAVDWQCVKEKHEDFVERNRVCQENFVIRMKYIILGYIAAALICMATPPPGNVICFIGVTIAVAILTAEAKETLTACLNASRNTYRTDLQRCGLRQFEQ